MKPTDEQVKKFWEWCGWKKVHSKESWSVGHSTVVYDWWINPEGERYLCLPNTTLDNLFKWAVPRLYPSRLSKIELVALVNNAMCDSIEQKTELAVALFWAIYPFVEAE